jgi:uncharacterized protein YjdB
VSQSQRVPALAATAVASLARRVSGAALLLCAAALPLAAQVITEVQVTPETMTIGLNRRQSLFAAAFDRKGNLVSSAKFSFASSDTAIVRVLQDGTVVGVRPGLAKVEVRAQGRRASSAVLVTADGAPPAEPATPAATAAATATPPAGATVLTLEPASIRLLPSESLRVTPRALKDDGSAVPLSQAAWKSLRPEVATVDSNGVVTAVAPGRSIVQASAGNLMATVPVEVEQADFSLSATRLVMAPEQLDTVRALVPSQGGREIATALRWRSTDSTVARVGPTGIVQALGAGNTEIIANGFAQERRVAVRVHPRPEVLVLTPRPSAGPVRVPLGGSRVLSVRALAADSTPIPEVLVGWELADTAIARFDAATGTVTGVALGTTSLTVRSAGFEPAVWVIEVVAGEIGLNRPRLGLAVGQSTRISASLRDSAGRALAPVQGTEWHSSRTDVAMVDSAGNVRAVGLGRAVVTARAPWGKMASAEVFVLGDLLVSSNRRGSFAVYQIATARPDSLIPVYSDSAASVQAVASPDRTRIVFSSNRAGNYDLYVMQADGSDVQRLTTDTGTDGEPTWTPDGAGILFTSTRGGIPQVYAMKSDGSDVRALTSSPGGNLSPAVSPDGRTVAFVSLRDGNYELYMMAIDGSNQRRLTTTREREAAPRFFPNGDLAYVTEGGNGGSRVRRLSPAAGTAATLVESEQQIPSFALSRDGTTLAYVAGRVTNASKGRTQFSFLLQPAVVGAAGTPVRHLPDEQIVSPSF